MFENVEPGKIPEDQKDRMMSRMTERIKEFIAGVIFEDDLHKLTCDQLGINKNYNPEEIDETDAGQVLVQTAYYNTYAIHQMRILSDAARGM